MTYNLYNIFTRIHCNFDSNNNNRYKRDQKWKRDQYDRKHKYQSPPTSYSSIKQDPNKTRPTPHRSRSPQYNNLPIDSSARVGEKDLQRDTMKQNAPQVHQEFVSLEDRIQSLLRPNCMLFQFASN